MHRMTKRQARHATRALLDAKGIAGNSWREFADRLADQADEPLTFQAAAAWQANGVPPHWAKEIEVLTGISRADLRPDVFR